VEVIADRNGGHPAPASEEPPAAMREAINPAMVLWRQLRSARPDGVAVAALTFGADVHGFVSLSAILW
jgi:hypothetical protein